MPPSNSTSSTPAREPGDAPPDGDADAAEDDAIAEGAGDDDAVGGAGAGVDEPMVQTMVPPLVRRC